MKRYALLFLLACSACGSGPPDSAIGEQSPDRLVGVWDVRMSLTNPYPLGPITTHSRKVCGAIAFVEYKRGSEASSQPAWSPLIGVYNLDLHPLGLEWLDENSLPTAFASEGLPVPAGDAAADSIRIELNTGGEERIVLLGRQEGGGILGDWSATSARGVASGAFSMHPRGPPTLGC